MSKYKVGDKFVVEISEVITTNPFPVSPLVEKNLYRAREFNGLVIDEHVLDGLERAPEQNTAGITAEEAWDIAKKLFADYTGQELDEIFGKGWSYLKLMELSPQEAKAKIEAWEKSKEEFQVGDVVQGASREDIKVLITRKYPDGTYNGIDGSGATYSGMRKNRWERTGRRYDIESILKKFKEDETNG